MTSKEQKPQDEKPEAKREYPKTIKQRLQEVPCCRCKWKNGCQPFASGRECFEPESPKPQAEKPKCRRCGGSGTVKIGWKDDWIDHPCPDCQPPKPEAGKLRELLKPRNPLHEIGPYYCIASEQYEKAIKHIDRLEIEHKRLREKIKIVCVGIDTPDYETKRKSMAEGIMPVDINKPAMAYHCGWQEAMLECGEILSKP